MNPATSSGTTGLHYQRSGHGPPLIILHGLFGSARNWHGIARALAGDFQVIVPDLRNHGDSPHRPGMSYADMGADIFALMDALELETAGFMGHSMGGKVAMSLALSQPGRVTRLIVVDIAPVSYRHDFRAIFAALKSLPLGQLVNRRQAQDDLRQRLADPVLCDFLLQNLRRDAQGFHWRVDLPALEQGMDAISGFPEDLLQYHYDGPTRFIAGGESRHIRPGHSPLIDTLFPRAGLVTIEGAGHWPHTEQAETFLSTVREFLPA